MAALQVNRLNKLQFAASLSCLFPNILDIPRRYAAAKEAGFLGVELSNAYDCSLQQLVAAREEAQLQQVQLNAFAGDSQGLACIPQRTEEFKQCLELSIQYCNALQCKRLHILAGQYPENVQVTGDLIASFRETYISNLKFAAQRLDLENVVMLIEPISTIPNYFLTKTDQALDILEEINCTNVKLQLDLFHHQRTHGNITDTLTNHLESIGHIQIGQVPDRHEPDSEGEINFTYIFNHLLKIGYKGWIGCEYIPIDSEKSFNWLEPYLDKPRKYST